MGGNGTSLEQRQRWMRETRSQGAVDTPPQFLEAHFTPQELAAAWNLSPDKVSEIFQNEPGVVVIGNRAPATGKRRRYLTLRIPASVAERVHRRLANAGP